MPSDPHTITLLLSQWHEGSQEAAEQLMNLVYGELHRLAGIAMRREQGGHTLQTTALVHEAYLRLSQGAAIDWQNRQHFYAVMAQQLRRVLVDYARRRVSEKRGGPAPKLSLLEGDGGALDLDERVLAVDEALGRLESLDPRAARVVELRYFAGLSEAEAAEVLAVSPVTVKRDWQFARTWLAGQLA